MQCIEFVVVTRPGKERELRGQKTQLLTRMHNMFERIGTKMTAYASIYLSLDLCHTFLRHVCMYQATTVVVL